MVRTFITHEIRAQIELGGLWDFYPQNGNYSQKQYKLHVPGCWEEHPGFISYRGKGVYKRNGEVGDNIRIVFKGVSHTADVFFDGKHVGHHYNAYTPFDIIIKNVEYGMHELMVEVDNSFNEESALHIPNDYYTYGGIIRPVVIQFLRDVYIQYVHFTPYRNNDTWMGEIKVAVKNIGKESKDVRIVSILDDTGIQCEFDRVRVNPDEQVILSKTFEFPGVTSYELDNPKLYLLRTGLFTKGDLLPIDDLIERVGFREIKVIDNHIYMNDKKLFIKGFCRHEDHPQFGCALPYQAMMYDINLIKDMGGNAVRTSHYPNDEIFLDLCDELGILVWEEAHARGLSEERMRHKNFRKQSLDCIEEMITNHYNHPSIFTWGILNECASNTEYGRECYAEQFNAIKKIDKSRPVTFASCHYKTDISLDLPDVVSFNVYPGWYHDTPEQDHINDVYNWVQNSTGGKGKPFIISEIGAGGIYGYRTPKKSKWSEERQAEILERQLNAVFSNENITGVFIWQFCDCRICEEERWFAGRPRTMNNKGMVDEYRRPKLVYETVKRIFNSVSRE